MAGRGRGRGRGRGTAVAPSEEPAAAPPPQSASQPVQPVGAAPIARGRGRGRGVSPAVAPSEVPPPVGGQDNVAAGRGRGRGAGAVDAGGETSRARGGAVAGTNGTGNGNRDTAGLTDRMANMAVTGGGDRRQRVNRHDEENLSSGYFNKGDWKLNVDSIRGQQVNLMANAITLYPPSDMEKPAGRLYHVDFSPQIDGRRLRLAIIMENADKLGGRNILYDGGSALFTGSLITDPNGKLEFSFTTKREEVVHVVCTHRSDIFAGSTEHLRIAGVLMKKGLAVLEYTPFGRHHFDPKSKIDLRNNYELWPGYATAVNKYEGGLLLVADTTFKLAAVRTVYQELLEIHQSSQGNTDAFQKQAVNKIVGRIVYTPYNQKRHRVDDINFDASPMDEFEKRGEKVSFSSYYQTAYGIEIKDARQPLLLSQPKEKDRRRGMTQPILLVPELCHVTGISDEQRADFRFTKAMSEHTRQTPDVKANNLLSLVKRFSQDQTINSKFQFWNMRFDKNLIQFHGRRLNSPNIHFSALCDYNKNAADFGTVLKSCRFRNPVSVGDYAVFYVKQNEQIAGTLNDKLHQAGNGFGMQFGQCNAVLVKSPRSEDWIQALKETQKQANGQMKLAIFVLPDNRADRYNAIKRVCYVEQPVPSQCVLMKTLSKPAGLMSVVSKLAMQINAKLGGEPWVTDFQLPGLMVIGMDVYHAGKNKSKSSVGVVGSLNNTLSRYYSRAYMNNEEDVHVLQPAITAVLNRFKENNEGKYPKYIVMFRDGVGEGQLGRVMNTEVESVQTVLGSLGIAETTKLCYVIVSKRIMQRFFSAGNRGDLQNPMPGTVVFDTLTKENRFDFFLAPTSSRQGTVTPTHYNVLFDDTPFRLDNGKLMDLAFHLSHLYYNWTGAIRVPAVCQYAHKLAAMCGDSLSNMEPTTMLADTLFYL